MLTSKSRIIFTTLVFLLLLGAGLIFALLASDPIDQTQDSPSWQANLTHQPFRPIEIAGTSTDSASSIQLEWDQPDIKHWGFWIDVFEEDGTHVRTELGDVSRSKLSIDDLAPDSTYRFSISICLDRKCEDRIGSEDLSATTSQMYWQVRGEGQGFAQAESFEESLVDEVPRTKPWEQWEDVFDLNEAHLLWPDETALSQEQRDQLEDIEVLYWRGDGDRPYLEFTYPKNGQQVIGRAKLMNS